MTGSAELRRSHIHRGGTADCSCLGLHDATDRGQPLLPVQDRLVNREGEGHQDAQLRNARSTTLATQVESAELLRKGPRPTERQGMYGQRNVVRADACQPKTDTTQPPLDPTSRP
jgi:hypothetical protein